MWTKIKNFFRLRKKVFLIILVFLLAFAIPAVVYVMVSEEDFDRRREAADVGGDRVVGVKADYDESARHFYDHDDQNWNVEVISSPEEVSRGNVLLGGPNTRLPQEEGRVVGMVADYERNKEYFDQHENEDYDKNWEVKRISSPTEIQKGDVLLGGTGAIENPSSPAYFTRVYGSDRDYTENAVKDFLDWYPGERGRRVVYVDGDTISDKQSADLFENHVLPFVLKEIDEDLDPEEVAKIVESGDILLGGTAAIEDPSSGDGELEIFFTRVYGAGRDETKEVVEEFLEKEFPVMGNPRSPIYFTRIYGSGRYHTETAAKHFLHDWYPGDDERRVVHIQNDDISAFLFRDHHIDFELKRINDDLSPEEVGEIVEYGDILLGGTAAIEDPTCKDGELDIHFTRIQGENRYETREETERFLRDNYPTAPPPENGERISPCPPYGDIADEGGFVSEADVERLQGMIGLSKENIPDDITEEEFKIADVTCSGTLEQADVDMLQDYIDGERDTLALCDPESNCYYGSCGTHNDCPAFSACSPKDRCEPGDLTRSGDVGMQDYSKFTEYFEGYLTAGEDFERDMVAADFLNDGRVGLVAYRVFYGSFLEFL